MATNKLIFSIQSVRCWHFCLGCHGHVHHAAASCRSVANCALAQVAVLCNHGILSLCCGGCAVALATAMRDVLQHFPSWHRVGDCIAHCAMVFLLLVGGDYLLKATNKFLNKNQPVWHWCWCWFFRVPWPLSLSCGFMFHAWELCNLLWLWHMRLCHGVYFSPFFMLQHCRLHFMLCHGIILCAKALVCFGSLVSRNLLCSSKNHYHHSHCLESNLTLAFWLKHDDAQIRNYLKVTNNLQIVNSKVPCMFWFICLWDFIVLQPKTIVTIVIDRIPMLIQILDEA